MLVLMNITTLAVSAFAYRIASEREREREVLILTALRFLSSKKAFLTGV